MSDIPEELIDQIQIDRDKAKDVVAILTAMIAKLQAENARLREALEEIARQKLVREGGDGDFVEGYEACVLRARAALAKEVGE